MRVKVDCLTCHGQPYRAELPERYGEGNFTTAVSTCPRCKGNKTVEEELYIPRLIRFKLSGISNGQNYLGHCTTTFLFSEFMDCPSLKAIDKIRQRKLR